MSFETDRDRALERLLRGGARGADASSTGPCPDAETLAAWIDGGLEPGAVRPVQAHAAECARCQSILAVMVHSVATPDDRAAPVPPRSPFRRALPWLVPVTGGAVAAALWLAVATQERAADIRFAVPVERPAEPAATAPRGGEDTAAQQQTHAEMGESLRQDDAPRTGADREQQADPARAPAKPQADAEMRASAKRRSSGTAAESVSVPTAPPAGAPAPPPGSARAAPGRLPSSAAAGLALDDAAEPLHVASPDPGSRWRITARGVEHSTDGGSTWTAQSLPNGVLVLAGAAPSASTCWLVGRGGVVLLTRDAGTWQRLPFPEAVDLIAVHASDGRTATIQSADGRSFRTGDGGLNWLRQ